MKKFFYLLLLILLLGTIDAFSQVTIGHDVGEPQEFSVLELISNASRTGGLRMPQLFDYEIEALTNSDAFKLEKIGKAVGLTVYNKTTNCIDYWDGSEWIARCDDNVCPQPDMPGVITLSTPGPLDLNELFVVSVPAVPGITYYWSIPPCFTFEGSSSGNSVALRAVLPGQQGLYNISVTATNDCGNTSTARLGEGFVQVRNCSSPPATIDPGKIVVTNISTGSGTEAQPYEVTEGMTFTFTYSGSIDPNVTYIWSLDTEGSRYFNSVAVGNRTITLRANAYDTSKDVPCGAGAISLTAINDCGKVGPTASGKRIKIVPITQPCPTPNPPGQITFSKSTVLRYGNLTASVPQETDITYTWSVPVGVTIVGSNTANPVALRVTSDTDIDLTKIMVTATNDCGNESDATHGTGTLRVIDPSGIPTGSGSLIGKSCFDIVYSAENDNKNGCGLKANRLSQKTDFTNRNTQDPTDPSTVSVPYSGVQVYTFRNPTATNVRFAVVDISGEAIKNYMQDSQDPNKLIIEFNESLNTRLSGLTRQTALKVEIYAVYSDAGIDKSLKMTLSLQDCACCGAKVANGGWLNFMCHNMGADEGFDPFKFSMDILGWQYQWGRITDGHQIRNSTVRELVIARTANGTLGDNGQAAGNLVGIFINSLGVSVNQKSQTDWRYPHDDLLWDAVKTKADPCPPGWKVPTPEQLQEVINNNSWSWSDRGAKIGDLLYLPGVGVRLRIDNNPGNPTSGEYWTSKGDTDPFPGFEEQKVGWILYIANNSYKVAPGSNSDYIAYRAHGRAVRCVEDR